MVSHVERLHHTLASTHLLQLSAIESATLAKAKAIVLHLLSRALLRASIHVVGAACARTSVDGSRGTAALEERLVEVCVGVLICEGARQCLAVEEARVDLVGCGCGLGEAERDLLGDVAVLLSAVTERMSARAHLCSLWSLAATHLASSLARCSVPMLFMRSSRSRSRLRSARTRSRSRAASSSSSSLSLSSLLP